LGDMIGVGVDNSKFVVLRGSYIHLFGNFCCMMYRLATMHGVTDRQTDRQTDDIIMPIIMPY